MQIERFNHCSIVFSSRDASNHRGHVGELLMGMSGFFSR